MIKNQFLGNHNVHSFKKRGYRNSINYCQAFYHSCKCMLIMVLTYVSILTILELNYGFEPKTHVTNRVFCYHSIFPLWWDIGWHHFLIWKILFCSVHQRLWDWLDHISQNSKLSSARNDISNTRINHLWSLWAPFFLSPNYSSLNMLNNLLDTSFCFLLGYSIFVGLRFLMETERENKVYLY